MLKTYLPNLVSRLSEKRGRTSHFASLLAWSECLSQHFPDRPLPILPFLVGPAPTYQLF